MIALKIVTWIIAWKKIDFAGLVKDAKSVAGFSPFANFESDGMTSHKHGLAANGGLRSRFFRGEFCQDSGHFGG